MGLTREQRIEAIIGSRFTERQARFLDLVTRMGGCASPASDAQLRRRGQWRRQVQRVLPETGVPRSCRPRRLRSQPRLAVPPPSPDASTKPSARARDADTADRSRRRQAIERLMPLDAVLTAPDVELARHRD